VYRFLLSRQWVILTLVALILIPVMIRLGFWQLHRHQHRVAQNALISGALAAPPVPARRLTSPGHRVTPAERYHRVTATGTFDTAHEVVVGRRTQADEAIGYHVLTPLDLADGRVLLVNRGWIPADGAQTAFPKIPAPARGVVRVTGRLMPDETTAASGIKDIRGLPARQTMLIASTRQAQRLGRQVLGGYVELTGPAPESGTPELLPSPDHGGIGPHMAYAVQWWLFSAGVPVGWTVLARREARERAAQAASASDTESMAPAAV
jgi:cytochrome oxidase assembly protein ShyY1